MYVPATKHQDKMDELLSLKWSNHCPTFINMLSILREKELYTDATLACNGKFYNVHKLVLSTCSDYFSAMLDQTNCKNPVVVLKDVKCQDLEALLDYMYLGEVVVRQCDLSTLIKAAEGLRIKGLAVPDDETLSKTMLSGKDCTNKRAILADKSPLTKRKRTSDESNAGFAAKEVKLSAPTHSTPSQPTSNPHSTFTSNSHNIADDSTTSPSRLASQLKAPSPYKAANQCKITSNSLDADTIQTFDSFESELNVKKEKDSSDGSDLCFVEETCKEETSESRDCLEESQATITDTLQEYLSQINSNQRNNSLLSPSSDCTSGFNNNDGMSGRRTEEEVGHISAAAECQSRISTSAAVTTLTPSPDRSPSKNSRLSGLERLSFADTLLGCVFPSSFTSGFTSNTSSPYPSTSSSTLEGISNHVIGSSRFDYTCFYCGKNFLFVSKLKEHLRTHTGERPFQCSFCSYRATRVWVLKRHVLTVHNREGSAGAPTVNEPDQHPLDASSGGGEDVMDSGAAALLDAAVAAGVFSLPPPQSPDHHRARETVGVGLLQCLRAAGSTASSNV